MTMKRMLAIAMLLCLCGIGFAQPPRGFYPWWDRPVAKDLDLTPAQMKQIRTNVRAYRGKLIELRAALERSELELQDVFDDEAIDQKKAYQAIENLAHARENLTRTFSEMALQLRLVLTQAQWKLLQKRRQELDAQKQKPPAAKSPQ
jgi:Spy/CpxP family protein refolding chaperone